jgi:hypothetical protein
MKSGGFDVIVGNPPYVVYPSKSVSYSLLQQGYKTLSAKNLYAFVYERSFALANSNSPIGLIVQLTSLSSEKLDVLQNLILSRGRTWIAPFPRRPESVFEGVEMPVAILLSHRGSTNVIHSTRVNRFYSEERPTAIGRLSYCGHSTRLHGHRIAKFGRITDALIFEKISRSRNALDEYATKKSENLLYYQEACRYWAKALNEVPRFIRNGQRMAPPHGRIIYFSSQEGSEYGACLLNSSMFYWYYSCFSDCEHINDSLVRSFPIGKQIDRKALHKLAVALGKALHDTAERKTIRTKQGHEIEYEELNASRAKEAIDQVDSMYAGLFDLSEFELDELVNYDIKYRMSQEGIDEEE